MGYDIINWWQFGGVVVMGRLVSHMPVYKDDKALKNPWYFEFEGGQNQDGKRKRIKKRGFRTKKEAEKSLIEAQNANIKGEYITPSKLSVPEYVEQWVNTNNNLTEDTKELYLSYLKNHIQPYFINIEVGKITPLNVTNFLQQLRSKGLSDSTVKRIYSVLNAAFNSAEKFDIVSKNVVSKVGTPRIRKRELKIWSMEYLKYFLEVTREESRYSIIFYLAAMTGMRQGELIGLRWKDIDFENSMIRIQQTYSRKEKLRAGAKTNKSIRSLAISPETVTKLLEHKSLFENERELNESYIDNDLVICSEKGTPVPPSGIHKVWKRLLLKYKAPNITFHGLRHTHATILLYQGVHPKIVSERLGHSSISITMDIYSHLIPNLQDEMIKNLDNIFK